MCKLLHKIAALGLVRPITLVLDNARYQHCALVMDLAATLNIKLQFLPSYSPNLNLIERLWKFIKRDVPYGRHYDNFAEFCKAIDGCLEAIPNRHHAKLATLMTHNSQRFEPASFLAARRINASHPDLSVTFLQQMELNKNDEPIRRFSWVSSLSVTQENATKLASGGRSRWKIENETFNTLKNQGYNLEHSNGHGQQNLSTVFLLLMLLTFMVDQIQQATCPLFQAALGKFRTHKAYWKHLETQNKRKNQLPTPLEQQAQLYSQEKMQASKHSLR